MPKYDYQWKDIVSLPEAVEVYCQHIGMGYNRHRIDRLFKEQFPGIDPYTLSKLRKAAFDLLRSRSKKINKEDYIAQQIEFLQSVRSNPNEKTKSRLAANKDLAQLLALDAAADGESPDAVAERIRLALSAMDGDQISDIPPEQQLKLDILRLEYNLEQKRNQLEGCDAEPKELPDAGTPDAADASDKPTGKQKAEETEFTTKENQDFKIMLAKQLGKQVECENPNDTEEK